MTDKTHTWIILYHHRNGNDAWLHQCEGQPDLDEIANGLDNFEPDRDEYLESIGIVGNWQPVAPTMNFDFDKRTRATIVAALRAYEEELSSPPYPDQGANAVATADDTLEPLTLDEIDRLCKDIGR